MSRIAALWPWIALCASAAMLGAAHAFERFAGLAPCALCLNQREAYWAAIGVALAAGAAQGARLRFAKIIGDGALACVFLVGAGIAAFHAGAEWGFWDAPATCANAAPGGLAAQDLLAALDQPQRILRCDEPAWVFLGLSMAGWNALISLGLALASGAAAALAWRKQA